MQNKKIIIGSVLLIGIFAVAFLVLSGNGSDAPVVQVSVDALTEEVTYTNAEGKISEINDSEQVAEGGVVSTSETGTALVLGEHRTYLDNSSSLTVKHVATGQSTFLLGAGRLWSRVEKLLEKGEYFEIETGNARAAVRGTSFGVSTTATTTKLLVAEGEVALALRSASGAILSYTEEVVPAGMKALVSGGTFEISEITDADMDEWFMLHNPRWVKPEIMSISPEPEVQVEIPNFAIPRAEEPVVKVETVGTVKQVETSSSLEITSVSPYEVTSSSQVTINGKGFTKVKSLILGKITISNYKILSDSKIQFNVGQAGLTPGIYDVSVIDLLNTFALKPKSLKVVEVPEADGNFTHPETVNDR